MNHPVSAEQRAAQVLEAFERIHREQMAGLPLLNKELAVAVSGFREVERRICGMVVTPWMMSLLLFPGEGERWEALTLGDKQSFTFPGGAYRCMQNVIDGLGPVMMYSVHSPVHAFPNQASALAEAALFIERAMTPATQASAADPVNEELLGRILRGEKVPEVDALVATLPGAETPASA